jgi:hypothetical protein
MHRRVAALTAGRCHRSTRRQNRMAIFASPLSVSATGRQGALRCLDLSRKIAAWAASLALTSVGGDLACLSRPEVFFAWIMTETRWPAMMPMSLTPCQSARRRARPGCRTCARWAAAQHIRRGGRGNPRQVPALIGGTPESLAAPADARDDIPHRPRPQAFLPGIARLPEGVRAVRATCRSASATRLAHACQVPVWVCPAQWLGASGRRSRSLRMASCRAQAARLKSGGAVPCTVRWR